MDQLVEPRIEAGLLESLKHISDQKGVPVVALINMAVKEFIFSLDDELEMAGMPNRAARLAAQA